MQQSHVVVMFALGALTIFGPRVLAIIFGTRAHGVFERRATGGHIRLAGAAGVGAVSLGVSAGVVVGVLVGTAILPVLLIAAIACLTVLAVIWSFLGLALLGGTTVVRS